MTISEPVAGDIADNVALSIAGGESFAPNRIVNNVLWLDASDSSTIINSSGSVSQWNDKSGSANNVTQGVGSEQPTTGVTTQNGRNVIDFDGGDSLELPAGILALPTSGATTTFVVSRRDSEDGTTDVIISMGQVANNKYVLFYTAISGEIRFRSNTGVVDNVESTGNTNTNFQVIRVRRDGSTQAISVNSETEVTDSAGADSGAIDLGNIGESVNGLFLTGSIAEIIMYDRTLSTSEIDTVEAYLSNKWGI